MKFLDRLFQIRAIEVRPQPVGEDELGIGALPEQEIAQAKLAAGADQKIGVGNVGGQKLAVERGLVEATEFALTCLRATPAETPDPRKAP